MGVKTRKVELTIAELKLLEAAVIEAYERAVGNDAGGRRTEQLRTLETIISRELTLAGEIPPFES